MNYLENSYIMLVLVKNIKEIGGREMLNNRLFSGIINEVVTGVTVKFNELNKCDLGVYL